MSNELAVIDNKTLEMLEKISEDNQLSKFDAGGGKWRKAIMLADGMNKLRAALTGPIMDRVMQLKGSSLGFRTDEKQGAPPYSADIVKDCLIEAVLRGAMPVGNEFNIISSRAYFTKEYFTRAVKEFPGLTDLVLTPSIPSMGASGAVVKYSATWKLSGVSHGLIRDIPVRVNAGMGADAILGKATRKMLAAIHTQLTGSINADGDVAEDDLKPATGVTLDSLDDIIPVKNPERRSSNDDHFAETAKSASREFPSNYPMGNTPAVAATTPTPAANPEAPASAETKGKRGRPAGSKNAPKVMPTPVPGSTAPADKPDAPAPTAAPTKATPPGVAPTTESQEVDESGSHEADEPQDMPDAGAKAADNAQHDDLDDLDDFDADSAENEEADKPIIRSMKFNSAKADTSNPAKPFYKLISEKNEIVGTHDLATVQKVAQLAMDKDENKRIVASYTIDVLLAKDGDKLILLGLAPGAVRKP